MAQADGSRQSAFSRWPRTGRRAVVRASDGLGIELKYNPWYDSDDGRFTFAGAGRYHGAGSGAADRQAPAAGPRDVHRSPATRPAVQAVRAGQPAGSVAKPGPSDLRGGLLKPAAMSSPNPVVGFAGGVADWVSGKAKGTIEGAYSALTTNPITTIRGIGRDIAGTIDSVMTAENVPARVQMSRAADAIANASARDIGYGAASTLGNGLLLAAPVGAASKLDTIRSLRAAELRPTFEPPQIGWVKENLGKDTPAKRYNDAVTGGRPGQAPTLTRTMPDGSKRPVKFDGVEAGYVIDRKFKVVDAPHARAQLIRQSTVLTEHRLIGTWEVPNKKQLAKAHKLLRKSGIKNIKVRMVKP